MSARVFLAIGECMIELSGGDEGLWRMGYAGDTLNAAWCARALLDREGWRVGYFTRLGTDGFSDRMLAFLGENGIDTAHVARDPKRSPGLYVIERKDGERSFTYWRDSSAARLLADDEALLARALGEAEIVYFSGITLAILRPDRRAALLDAVAARRKTGALTAFDPNIRPRLWEDAEATRDWIARAAAASSLVLPSFEDEAAAFGDASPDATADRYLACGAGEVVVKDGPGAALVAWRGGRVSVPTAPAERVVDTTGAGDGFNGSYLAARAEGSAPPEAAAAGHRVARMVVQRHGALLPFADIAQAASEG